MIVRGVTLQRRESQVGVPGVSVGEGRAKMPETEFGRGGRMWDGSWRIFRLRKCGREIGRGEEGSVGVGEAKRRGGICRGCAIGVREFPTEVGGRTRGKCEELGSREMWGERGDDLVGIREEEKQGEG